MEEKGKPNLDSSEQALLSTKKSVEIRERELQQKILECQLEYGVKLMNKEIKFFNKERGQDGEFVDIESFEDVVKNWTRIPVEIRIQYCLKTGASKKWLKEDAVYEEVFDRIIVEICKEYRKNPDSKVLSVRALSIISDVINTLPALEKDLRGEERKEVGVLKYEIFRPDEYDRQNYGLDPSKDYIDIHLDSLFWQQAQPGKEHLTRENLPNEIKKSCAQLGQIMKEKYPDAAGVICTSWIVGVDWFADAVGFGREPIVAGSGIEKGNAFWGQFISKTGLQKQKKLDNLISGNEPEYKTMFNFVSTEDFLKMHAEK